MERDSEKEMLFLLAKQFIEQNKIYHAEQIYEEDNIIVNAYYFLELVCDIVGYKDDKEPE